MSRIPILLLHLFLRSLHASVGWMGTTILALTVGLINYYWVVPWVEKRLRKEKPVKTDTKHRITASVLVTGVTWLLLFSFGVVTVIYQDHQRLVGLDRQLAKQNAEQCWMQNISLPAPRTVPAALAASEVVTFCNIERKAPLVIFVDYDKPPLLAGPIAFPGERQSLFMEHLDGKRIFLKLDSPPILPYQMFIVTVYGGDEKPPLATEIAIKPVNSER